MDKETAIPECYYCHRSNEEMRPYGPGGTEVCFECAFKTPEREAQTKAAFTALLDGAEAVSPLNTAVIGQESGPQPYIP